MVVFAVVMIGITIAGWVLISRAVVESVERLTEPETLLAEREDAEPDLEVALDTTQAWARRHGFKHDRIFDFQGSENAPPIRGATWRNESDATILAVYAVQTRSHFDLVTIYDEVTSLTTSGSMDAQTLPAAPGAFVQSFPDADLDELLRRHREGRAELETLRQLPAARLDADTMALMARAIRRQAEHVQTIPMWEWRGPWWYFVRRRTMADRTVGDQLRKAA